MFENLGFEFDQLMEMTEDETGNPEAEAEAAKNAEEHFRIDNDQKAEWALNKIRECDAELQKWTDFYQSKIDGFKKYCEIRRGFFEHLLSQYFQTVPKKETKTQLSYQLPSGKLVLKRQGPEFERDETVLLPWLKENGFDEYVKTKESVDWAGLKKIIEVAGYEDADGNHKQVAAISSGDSLQSVNAFMVPGITVTERPDVFKVEVK